MANNFYKKFIFFLVLFFGLFNHTVFAWTIVDTETVTIGAKVGNDILNENGSGGGVLSGVRFSGEAYPYALVSVLQNGQERVSVVADTLGRFNVNLSENYNNNILYTLVAKDVAGNRSLLINYPIVVYTGFITELSGIRFAPTIVTDKAQVKQGDYLTVSGYALPEKNLEIYIQGVSKEVYTLISSKDGSYKITLPMQDLPKWDYVVYIKYKSDTRVSKLVKFIIGDTDIYNYESEANIPGDCNADKIINLVDFSVLAYWYGKDNPPRCVDTNSDGIINLIDFSILAFYWTG